MTELTASQFSLVYNVFSFTIASMGAAFIFFLAARSQVAPKYRGALLISSLVVAIACYHYFRIFNSWNEAFNMNGNMYMPSGKPFNDAYRYVDWLLTVPLLLVELVAVLALPKNQREGLFGKLAIAAFLMIALGYPGEVATDNTTRAVWGTLSSIPFAYILMVLWGKLGTAIESQPGEAKVYLTNIRLLLILTWGFYPITYMLPMFGIQPQSAVVGIQVGYAISDVLAKAFYGVMIYWIARAKSEAEGFTAAAH
ncbi:MAG: xanthorhodopsin [Proteobacteria bacterium]|nr:xanthorhodopsin [Pseudomonadota bacterium]